MLLFVAAVVVVVVVVVVVIVVVVAVICAAPEIVIFCSAENVSAVEWEKAPNLVVSTFFVVSILGGTKSCYRPFCAFLRLRDISGNHLKIIKLLDFESPKNR